MPLPRGSLVVGFTLALLGCGGATGLLDPQRDAARDALEASADAGTDVGLDARPDTTLDAPSDTSRDAPLEVTQDVPLDLPLDVPLDVPRDAPTDAPDACVPQVPGSWRPPPADPTCPANQWRCNGGCTRLSEDPFNCGACGVRCCGGWCFSGVCGLEGPPGTAGCNWSCGPSCVGATPTNLNVDPANCGACGFRCPPGRVCSAGVCG